MAVNPYANKVQTADGTVLIDLTADTVSADKMLYGTTAHDRSGAVVTGTMFGVGSLWATRDGGVTPNSVLGFGTWRKIAPTAATWGDLENTTWSNLHSVPDAVYVWERIS